MTISISIFFKSVDISTIDISYRLLNRARLSEKRKAEEEDEVGMVLDWPVVVTAPRWAVFSFSIGGHWPQTI